MITYLTHILTTNLEQFLTVLTTLAIVAISGLIVLELIKKSRSSVKVFWILVYVFTLINVVFLAFVLC